MKKHVSELIQIDTSLATPVYKQIVQSIYRNIENGVLVKDDVLPSVNKISEEFSLARGSVFSAYNDLRASGIIDSIPGKGYFVSSTETKQAKRIFLLFNSYTAYKEVLFNSLLNNLPANASLDIYFHHHDIKRFETLMREQAGYYNSFIIMPEVHNDTLKILSGIDPKKILLLDVGYKEYRKDLPGVFQHYEKDIYTVLIADQQLAKRYKRLMLVAPDESGMKEIFAGFNKYSKKSDMYTSVVAGIDKSQIKKGDAFVVVDDNQLVELVLVAKENGWHLGKDIGVLSYNETPLKSVIGEGITTITPDFEAMGKTIAGMVMNGKREAVENPYKLVNRNSF